MRFWRTCAITSALAGFPLLAAPKNALPQPDIGYTLHFNHLRGVSEVVRAVALAQEAGATVVSVVPSAHSWECKAAVEMVRAAFRETQARRMKVILSRMDAEYPNHDDWLFEYALTKPGRMPDGSPTSSFFCATVGNKRFEAWQRAETAYYAEHFGREPNLVGVAVGGFVEPFVSERGSLLDYSDHTLLYEVAQYTPEARDVWHEWLRHHFGSLAEVHAQYLKRFSNFDKIPMPVSEKDPRFGKPRRAYYDFLRSLNDWVLNQYRVNRAIWHRYSEVPFILQFSGYLAEKMASGRSCFAAFDLPEWIRQADALGISFYTHYGYEDWGHSSACAMVNLLAHAREHGKQVFVMESGCEMPYPVVISHELLFATRIGLSLQPSSYIYEYLKYADQGGRVSPGHMLDTRFQKHEPGFSAVSTMLRQDASSNGLLPPPVFYFLSLPETARDDEEAGVIVNAVYAVAGWIPCRFVPLEEANTIPPGASVLIAAQAGLSQSRRLMLLETMKQNRWRVVCTRATAARLRSAGLPDRFLEYPPSLLRGDSPEDIAQALGDFIVGAAPLPLLPFLPQPGLAFVLSTTKAGKPAGTLYAFVEEGATQLDISETGLPGKGWNIMVSRRDGKPTRLVLRLAGPSGQTRRIVARNGQSLRLGQ